MRFKSKKTNGYQAFAVSGTNTISFAINGADANTKGLLGFAVERLDPQENQRFFVDGFKVFKSVMPNPTRRTTVKTFDHPIQSFVYDDFTAKPGRPYEYFFHPLKGTAKNLDRSAPPIAIKVRTEKLFSDGEHDIFFNRGVASSQAYERKFNNKPPEEQETEKKKEEARQWLSRELDDAMLEFIKRAGKDDTLLCCFYEFRYKPVAEKLKQAITRGVKVRIIFDAKKNAPKGEPADKAFPRTDNLKMIKGVKIPNANVIPREAKPTNIQHNKFMVLLKGAAQEPREVWTGSTNVSEGGIMGQTNVGHWVRNKDVAAKFEAYWDLLSKDPGPVKGDDRTTARKKNDAFRRAVEAIVKVPVKRDDIKKGVTAVFSPRGGLKVLEMYAHLVDDAKDLSCITLAFGINKLFKDLLRDNTPQSHLAFFLLEKEDKPDPKAKQPFIAINAKNNVYKAWGSFLRNPLHQWARETSAGGLGLNKHVSFIHSKFLLMDPLSDDPIVVTGSANFSAASTNANDENMLVIRGNRRVADIYFTEFNRLFFHYYFRSVQQASLKQKNGPKQQDSLFLDETDGWLKKYVPGKLRHKRVLAFAKMKGTET